jgi:hypothetical protein
MIKALAAAALIFTAAAPAMADPLGDYRCGRAAYCGNDLNSFKQSIKHKVCGMGVNGAEALVASVTENILSGELVYDERNSTADAELAAAAFEAVAVASAQGRCRNSNTVRFFQEIQEAG